MVNLTALQSSVDKQKKGTTGADLLNKPKGITPGTVGVQGGQFPTPTPTKPKPTTNVAANLARNETAFNKQGATGSEGTAFNPAQALQNQQPGDAPISPYVAGKQPDVTPPAKPTPSSVTGASGAVGAVDTTSSIQQATDELTPGTEEYIAGNDKLFDIANDLKDEKIASLEELHQRNIDSLAELQKMQEEITAQKNAMVTASAEVQNQEVQAAYDANTEALRIAKERLDASQRQVLSEREKQLERKKINEENMLALIGGFGSMAGNKMLIDSVEEGEQAMGVLKTEYSFQDQEHSAKVVALNNDYKNDKLKIEQWKQETILQNYENLQNYIEDITRDEMMSDADKVKAINNAKDQYNNTISQLHQNVIDAKFELSREILDRADQLRAEFEEKKIRDSEQARQAIGDARGDLTLMAENYALENYDTLSQDVKTKIAEIEKRADLPAGFTEQAIKNFKAQNAGQDMQIRFEKDDQGNLTIIGVDKKTGLVAATSQVLGAGTTSGKTNLTLQGPEGNMLDKNIFTSTRLLNEPVGSDTINGVEVKAKASVIKKLKSADDAMKADGLGGLKIRSSFRTNQEQAGINTDSPEATNASEGQSFHEAGQAVDVDNWQEAEPYLRAQGMVNDLSWDKGHFSIGETNKVSDAMKEVKPSEFDEFDTTAPSATTSATTAEPAPKTSYEDEFADFK